MEETLELFCHTYNMKSTANFKTLLTVNRVIGSTVIKNKPFTLIRSRKKRGISFYPEFFFLFHFF